MPTPRVYLVILAPFVLSACNGPSAQQVSTNGALESGEAVSDANARAERLAEQAALLDGEAAKLKGARRQALQNEASADMSEAVNVQQEGEADAENIAANTEREVRVLRRP